MEEEEDENLNYDNGDEEKPVRIVRKRSPETYTNNLSKQAEENRLDLIGRENELQRMHQILCRRRE